MIAPLSISGLFEKLLGLSALGVNTGTRRS